MGKQQPQCEVCGKAAPLSRALIEGTPLNVCSGCGGMGKILPRIAVIPKKTAPTTETVTETVVTEYAQLIRNAREKRGLTQKEFALTLNEKESVLSKIENGHTAPPIPLARKLERLLHIILVTEERIITPVDTAKTKSHGFTLGDFVKTR